jgi:hypothetical protein
MGGWSAFCIRKQISAAQTAQQLLKNPRSIAALAFEAAK